MPQATEELRAEMQRRFGDRICDQGPRKFLESRGWKLNDDWSWSKSGFNGNNTPEDELNCIIFLFQEWDFNLISTK